MDSPGAVGRRRGNSRINAEDQALDQIAKEASTNPPLTSSTKMKKKHTRSLLSPPSLQPEGLPPPPHVITGVQHESFTAVTGRSGSWTVESAIHESATNQPDYTQHQMCVYYDRTGRWVIEDVQEDDDDQDDLDAMIKSLVEHERSLLDSCEGRRKSKKKKSKKHSKSQDRESHVVAVEEVVNAKPMESQNDSGSSQERSTDPPQPESAASVSQDETPIVLYPPLEELPADEAVTVEIVKSVHDDSGAVLQEDSPPKPLKDLEPSTPLEQMKLADLKEMVKQTVVSITTDMIREVEMNSVEHKLLRERVRLLNAQIYSIAQVMESWSIRTPTKEIAVQADLQPVAISTPEKAQTAPAPTISDRSFRRPDDTPLNPTRIAAPKRRLTLFSEDPAATAGGCYVEIEPCVAGRNAVIAAGQWIAIEQIRDRVGQVVGTLAGKSRLRENA